MCATTIFLNKILQFYQHILVTARTTKYNSSRTIGISDYYSRLLFFVFIYGNFVMSPDTDAPYRKFNRQ